MQLEYYIIIIFPLFPSFTLFYTLSPLPLWIFSVILEEILTITEEILGTYRKNLRCTPGKFYVDLIRSGCLRHVPFKVHRGLIRPNGSQIGTQFASYRMASEGKNT